MKLVLIDSYPDEEATITFFQTKWLYLKYNMITIKKAKYKSFYGFFQRYMMIDKWINFTTKLCGILHDKEWFTTSKKTNKQKKT